MHYVLMYIEVNVAKTKRCRYFVYLLVAAAAAALDESHTQKNSAKIAVNYAEWIQIEVQKWKKDALHCARGYRKCKCKKFSNIPLH